jgi:heterotetrameric sarcosine oxidase gamma subunit
MTLTTTSELPFQSPIEGETGFEVPGVAWLKDLTPTLGVLHLRGPEVAEAVLRFSGDQTGQNALAIGEARSIKAGSLCRLAMDEVLLLADYSQGWESTCARLEESVQGKNITVSDLTHGYGKLEISGPDAARLLPKLCGLDFSESSFPNGRVAQTSFAKVHATLVRMDGLSVSPKYLLLVDRSLSAYVWEVVKAVMQTFNT